MMQSIVRSNAVCQRTVKDLGNQAKIDRLRSSLNAFLKLAIVAVGVKWSDSEIGRRCKVSYQLVANIRSSLPTVGSERKTILAPSASMKTKRTLIHRKTILVPNTSMKTSRTFIHHKTSLAPSASEIGRRCKVHHTLVGRIRRSLVLNTSEKTERTYITKHGTKATMPLPEISVCG